MSVLFQISSICFYTQKSFVVEATYIIILLETPFYCNILVVNHKIFWKKTVWYFLEITIWNPDKKLPDHLKNKLSPKSFKISLINFFLYYFLYTVPKYLAWPSGQFLLIKEIQTFFFFFYKIRILTFILMNFVFSRSWYSKFVSFNICVHKLYNTTRKLNI